MLALPTNSAELNERLEVINDVAKRVARNSNITLVDPWVRFTNQNGLLDPRLTTDGVHLNADGYDILMEENWASVKQN